MLLSDSNNQMSRVKNLRSEKFREFLEVVVAQILQTNKHRVKEFLHQRQLLVSFPSFSIPPPFLPYILLTFPFLVSLPSVLSTSFFHFVSFPSFSIPPSYFLLSFPASFFPFLPFLSFLYLLLFITSFLPFLQSPYLLVSFLSCLSV